MFSAKFSLDLVHLFGAVANGIIHIGLPNSVRILPAYLWMNHAARWADRNDTRSIAIRLFVHNVGRLNNTLHG
jgi:hypothetical protein